MYAGRSWRYDSLRGRKVRGSNPAGGEIFSTLPDRPWGPLTLLPNGYRVYTAGKEAGRGVKHPPLCTTEVQGRVQLYTYAPSGPFISYS